MNIPSITEKEFWFWFSKNQHRFFTENGKTYERLLDELTDELHGYCRELQYEVLFSDDKNAELIISAFGDKNYFDRVLKLVGDAPEFDSWTITAFKPPSDRDFVLDIDGLDMATGDMYFEPLSNSRRPGQLGLSIYVKDFDQIDQNTLFGAVHVILMTLIGEKAAAEDIHYVRINKLYEVEEKYMPLTCLPEYLDWFKSKFN